MANEIRLRSNFQSGTITDNPLLVGSTTINSAGFASLPVVDTTNHLILVLDPTGIGGAPEIVRVTAHTAAATVVTGVRGAGGTAARQHSTNTAWFHAPVDSDYGVQAATFGTLPAGAYKGQRAYTTDDNKVWVFDGTTYAANSAGGQLAYVQMAGDQTGISAETDITGLSATVTLPANRRIRIDLCLVHTRTVNDGTSRFRIKEGATTLQQADGFVRAAGEGLPSINTSYVTTPTAGTHTYKATALLNLGSGTLSVLGSNAECFLLITDIGSSL
jgi:hypothetical protein